MLLSGVPAEAILSPTNFRRAALGTLFQPRQTQDRFVASEVMGCLDADCARPASCTL